MLKGGTFFKEPSEEQNKRTCQAATTDNSVVLKKFL